MLTVNADKAKLTYVSVTLSKPTQKRSPIRMIVRRILSRIIHPNRKMCVLMLYNIHDTWSIDAEPTSWSVLKLLNW